MHNDGRLGELRAAAKDLLPVEQRQPKREFVCARVCVWCLCICVCVCVDWGLVLKKNEADKCLKARVEDEKLLEVHRHRCGRGN